MRNILSALLLIITSIFATAQTSPSSNLKLGYQEFPTVIHGHAADSNGNQYYTGYFRGQLTINKQVVATGNGLEDLFWAKTDSAGRLLAHKTFGSGNTDVSYPSAAAMTSNGRLLFGFRSFEKFNLGAVSFTPYMSPTGNGFAAGIAMADTSGKVLWAKRTTLQNFRIHATDNLFHVVGLMSPNSGPIKLEDSVVIDSIGRWAIAHLVLNESGYLLAAKTITSRSTNTSIILQELQGFSDGSLLFALRLFGDTAINVGSNVVPVPQASNNCYVFIKTDTAYKNYRVKTINQGMVSLSHTGFPVTVSPADSVYMVLSIEHAQSLTSVDGFEIPLQTNTLLVLDSGLTVRRRVLLGSTVAGNYPAHLYKRKIYFHSLLVHNNQLYMRGVNTGINESPFVSIPRKDTVFTALPGVTATFNQNGGSRSFLARCNLSVTSNAILWYGDHTRYENLTVPSLYLHAAGNTHVNFVLAPDNVWNPWLVDSALRVVTGTMQQAADAPEQPFMVQHFDDGSRMVIGYARGRTALDSGSAAWVTNFIRSEIFLARIGVDNKVLWYKRWYCTLQQAEIRALQMRNNKAYFLANYRGTQNDSNYLQLDNNAYHIGVNASLMASIDASGAIQVHNLSQPQLRSYMLQSFSFFNNGDIALATGPSTPVYPGFSAGTGTYIFRLNSSGAVADVRKLYGLLGIAGNSMQIDANDNIYLSGSYTVQTSQTMGLYNKITLVDSIRLSSAPSSRLGLLKFNWNRFAWFKRITSNHSFGSNRVFGELQLVNNQPVIVHPTMLTTTPVSWDGNTVHTGYNGFATVMMRLDTAGNLIGSKTYKDIFMNYVRKSQNGGLFLSGNSSRPLQIDAIAITNMGGPDGIGLVLDTALTAKKHYRIATAYAENLLDMDIYKDTAVAFAYMAQTTPQIYNSRTSANTSDYEEDAFLGTLIIRNNVTTSLRNPLPPGVKFVVAPNPIQNNQLQLQVQSTTTMQTVCNVHSVNGQIIDTRMINLTSGNNDINIPLQQGLGKGIYYVTLPNKSWKATRAFVLP